MIDAEFEIWLTAKIASCLKADKFRTRETFADGDVPGGCCLVYSRDFGEINSAALPLHRFGDMLEAE